MFVGHYSAAFAAKAVEPRVPIWLFLLAAQLVDVFWALFVLTGIEAVRLDPTLASNPLDLYHMPYTHSLLATGFWAGAAGLLTTRSSQLGGTLRAGVLVGLVVASHWLLDFLVHRPDLTLWGAAPKLGLGLWDRPELAFALELGFLAAGATLYVAVRGLSARHRRAVVIAVGTLALLQAAVSLGPVPASVPALMVAVLAVFVVVSYAGWRAERWAQRVRA